MNVDICTLSTLCQNRPNGTNAEQVIESGCGAGPQVLAQLVTACQEVNCSNDGQFDHFV